jgi:hypothetical protein
MRLYHWPGTTHSIIVMADNVEMARMLAEKSLSEFYIKIMKQNGDNTLEDWSNILTQYRSDKRRVEQSEPAVHEEPTALVCLGGC